MILQFISRRISSPARRHTRDIREVQRFYLGTLKEANTERSENTYGRKMMFQRWLADCRKVAIGIFFHRFSPMIYFKPAIIERL
ncbi:MAG: hypothetical protein B6D34_02520 [Candidatus Brocadia sp. UTAMX1]|nr:MAG: hypothetical protein B6D34_02520 [Candidatus Brocadia sp. UTAMX1]